MSYFNKFLKPLAGFKDNIDYGSAFNLSVTYIKLKKINFGIGINYYRASASKEEKYANIIQSPYSEFKMTITTAAILPELFMDYSIYNINNTHFHVGLSGLYGFCEISAKGQVDDQEEERFYKHSPDGFGLKVFTSISKNIRHNCLLGIEVGYKNFISDDIMINRNKWYVEVVDQETPMNLDFSGIYLMGKFIFVV